VVTANPAQQSVAPTPANASSGIQAEPELDEAPGVVPPDPVPLDPEGVVAAVADEVGLTAVEWVVAEGLEPPVELEPEAMLPDPPAVLSEPEPPVGPFIDSLAGVPP
jgi:hypothetical protein